MPLLKDLATARRLARKLWRSRVSRRDLAARLLIDRGPAARSIKIGVYFADGAVNLYQVRQWYSPLAKLAERWPVAIMSRSPGAALALLDEAPVPTVYLRTVLELENFIASQDLRVILYVNQNSRNFQMMRYSRLWHVFINHGESDKMYMTTNQFKAYDYSLVAGQAAIDRLDRKLWDFDVAKRVIPIGRPQADHLEGRPPFPADDRIVVLYAPTWEGDRAGASYGSIASHGVGAVAALIASGRHRVIYRPHPRSGVVDRDYGRANDEIVAMLGSANSADPDAQHVVDTGATMGWQLAVADVAITDISAMVYDRLATGRPLIVTRPTSPLAEIDEGGYLGDAEWLLAGDAESVVATIDRVLGSEESRHVLEGWVRHHFGDTAPGAATARFHAAIEHLMTEWDRHAAMHPPELVPESRDDERDDDDDDDEMVIRKR